MPPVRDVILFYWAQSLSVGAPLCLITNIPYFRKKLDRINQTFAGRSARRRMKYGYHSVP